MEDDKGHVARTLNNRLKALENENSGLGMVKSQCILSTRLLHSITKQAYSRATTERNNGGVQ